MSIGRELIVFVASRNGFLALFGVAILKFLKDLAISVPKLSYTELMTAPKTSRNGPDNDTGVSLQRGTIEGHGGINTILSDPTIKKEEISALALWVGALVGQSRERSRCAITLGDKFPVGRGAGAGRGG